MITISPLTVWNLQFHLMDHTGLWTVDEYNSVHVLNMIPGSWVMELSIIPIPTITIFQFVTYFVVKISDRNIRGWKHRSDIREPC